jgi:1-acyl-sn-glycerol-3-phosphate acyltransferase
MPDVRPANADGAAGDAFDDRAAFRVLRSRGFIAFLCTQFLGAFNDNVFKLLISLFAVRTLADPERETFYVTLAAGLFTAPFLLFSPYAGYLADRFSKKRIMVWVKGAEIAIMLAGVGAFFAGSLTWLLAILFCMGSQSAFFGPAKYGFLPEVLSDEALSRGNGSVQLWTFVAIIVGGALGGQLSQTFGDAVFMAASFCVLIAVAGFLTSLFITPTRAGGSAAAAAAGGSEAGGAGEPADPEESVGRGRIFRIVIRVFRVSVLSVFRTVGEMRHRGYLFHCLMGTGYFWFLGALFQVNILFYAKTLMGASDRYVGILQATVALGMGVGSMLAGRFSGKKIEFGLVPFGALAMSFFSVALGFSFRHSGLTLACAGLLGASAGFYNIPLASYIQQQSPPESRGRYLATNNVIAFSAMTLSYPLLWLLRGRIGLTAGEVFCVVGVTTALVLVALVGAIPDMFVRSLMWLVAHVFHRLHVDGQHHVPKEGGALIVCNHVSLMDGILVKVALQRPVRFLIHREYYDNPWLRPFLRVMKAIPVADSDGPGALKSALRAAGQYLADGEVVCVFPEGMITRMGNLLPFSRGIETILRGVDAPVIPACLDGLWGGFFARGGPQGWRRRPSVRRRRVTLLFGRPLPSDVRASEAREAVAALLATAGEL